MFWFLNCSKTLFFQYETENYRIEDGFYLMFGKIFSIYKLHVIFEVTRWTNNNTMEIENVTKELYETRHISIKKELTIETIQCVLKLISVGPTWVNISFAIQSKSPLVWEHRSTRTQCKWAFETRSWTDSLCQSSSRHNGKSLSRCAIRSNK